METRKPQIPQPREVKGSSINPLTKTNGARKYRTLKFDSVHYHATGIGAIRTDADVTMAP